MAITRTVAGLVFEDTFNRADGAPGANYVVEAGVVAIAGNRLVATAQAGGVDSRVRIVPLSGKKDLFIQTTSRRTSLNFYTNIVGRRTANFLYVVDSGSSTDTHVNQPRLIEWVNPTYYFMAYGAAGLAGLVNSDVRVSAQFNGLQYDAWCNGTKFGTGTDGALANVAGEWTIALSYGAFVAGSVSWSSLVACTDRKVTITGLPAGYQVRANGGAPSAAAVAGTPLVFDPGDVAMPFVLDVRSGPVTMDTMTATYGGDTLAYVGPGVLTGRLALPWGVHGTLIGSRVVRGALALPWRVAGRIEGSLALLGRLVFPWRIGGTLTERATWEQVDFGPDILDQPITVLHHFGRGPEAGKLLDTVYNNATLTDGNLTATFLTYVVPSNSAGWQSVVGTGVGSGGPTSVAFSLPVKRVVVEWVEMTFYNGYLAGFDVNGVEVARYTITHANYDLAGPWATIEVAGNTIARIVLQPNNDWVTYRNLDVTRAELGAVGGWQSSDAAPDAAWAPADADPATVWN